jgi:hypothetical protein
MSKFLLNLLLQIFKALVNSKIQFLIRKFFFLILARPTLRPTQPLAQPAHWPRRPHRPKPSLVGPSSPRIGHLFARNTSSLLIHAFRAGRLSLVSPTTGPQLSAPSPTSNRPSSPAPPSLPGHQAPPSSMPRVPPDRYHLAFISPPLNGVKAIITSVKHPGHPSPALPRPPIKGEHPHRVSPHLSPLLFPLSPHLSSPLTEHRRRRTFTTVARPPRRRLSPSEALDELPVRSSLCCAPAGELWRTGAAGGRAPVSASPRPSPPLSAPPSVHGGPSVLGRSTDLSVEK